jgi:hypothetical protein
VSFNKQDTDKDGAIGFHELKVALRALGFDLKKTEVLKILRDHDRQGSGQMQFDDFSKVGRWSSYTVYTALSRTHLITLRTTQSPSGYWRETL